MWIALITDVLAAEILRQRGERPGDSQGAEERMEAH
jgi:hypothetical protein